MKVLATARHARFALALSLAVGLAGFAACGGTGPTKLPAGTVQPDKWLFDKGTESLKSKKYIRAREYFQQLWDNYPQSPYRADGKLGLGDAYLGEDSPESLVLAGNEFREFLTYLPSNPRADYAQYKLALSHFAQMSKPDRDQKETRAAIKEFDTFVARYPNSPLMPEAKKDLRAARDRLSQSEYLVGLNYYKWRVYGGAANRFRSILKDDPSFTGRDGVYYYLAECLIAMNLKAEALPYLERLVEEFQQSQFLAKAQVRIKELKG